MIDLTQTLIQAQIAFSLAVIAFGTTYYFFAKKPAKPKNKK